MVLVSSTLGPSKTFSIAPSSTLQSRMVLPGPSHDANRVLVGLKACNPLPPGSSY